MSSYRLIEDTAAGYHDAVSAAFAVLSSGTYRFSGKFKSTNRGVVVQLARADGAGALNVYFDLQAGTNFGQITWGTFYDSATGVSMVSQGNGVWLCSFSIQPANYSGQLKVGLYLDKGNLNDPNYTGDGASLVEVDTPTFSLGTTVLSNDFGAWTLSGASRQLITTQVATTTSLTSSANPSTVGQSVTLTATVNPTS